MPLLGLPCPRLGCGGLHEPMQAASYGVECLAELVELGVAEVGEQLGGGLFAVGRHASHCLAAQVGQRHQQRAPIGGVWAAFQVSVRLQRVDQSGHVPRAHLQGFR